MDYKERAKGEEIWVSGEEISNLPDVIRKEYELLFESVSNDDICGAIFRLKDIYETSMKIPAIMSIIVMSSYIEKENDFVSTSNEQLLQEKERQMSGEVSDDEKEESRCIKKFRIIMSKMLKEPLAIGTWNEVLYAIDEYADVFELNNYLSDIVKRTIELLKIRPHKSNGENGQFENVSNWRNKVIGHGTLMVNTEAYWIQVYDLVKGLQEYFVGDKNGLFLNDLYKKIYFKEEDRIQLFVDEKEYEISEYLYEIDDDCFFFDSYFNRQKCVEVTNYLSTSKRLKENVYFQNIYANCIGDEKSKTGKKKKTSKKVSTSIDREMFACLNSVPKYEKPDFILEQIRSFMESHSKGVLYIQMERGMGKSTLAHNLDGRYQRGILQKDLDAVVRVYHIRDTLLRTENRITDFYTSLENNLKSFDCGKQLEVDDEEYENEEGNDIRKEIRKGGEDAKYAFAEFLELFRYRYEEEFGESGEEYKLVYIIDGIDELNNDTKCIVESLPSNALLDEISNVDNIYIVLLSRLKSEDCLPNIAIDCIKECEELSGGNTIVIDDNNEDYYALLTRYIKSNYKRITDDICTEIIEKAKRKFLYIQPYMAMGEAVLQADGALTAANVAENYINGLLKRYWGLSQNTLYLILSSIAVFGTVRLKEICNLILFTEETYDVIGCMNDIMPLLTAKRTDGDDVYEYANEEYSKVVLHICDRAVQEVITRFRISVNSWYESVNIKSEDYGEQWAFYIDKILTVERIAKLIGKKCDEEYVKTVLNLYQREPDTLYAAWIRDEFLINLFDLVESLDFAELEIISYKDLRYPGLEEYEPETWANSKRKNLIKRQYEYTNKMVEHCKKNKKIDEWFKLIAADRMTFQRDDRTLISFRKIAEDWHDEIIADYLMELLKSDFKEECWNSYGIHLEILLDYVEEDSLREKILQCLIWAYAIYVKQIKEDLSKSILDETRRDKMLSILMKAREYTSINQQQIKDIEETIGEGFIFQYALKKILKYIEEIRQLGAEQFLNNIETLSIPVSQLDKNELIQYKTVMKKAVTELLIYIEEKYNQNDFADVYKCLCHWTFALWARTYEVAEKMYVERLLDLYSKISRKLYDAGKINLLSDIGYCYNLILRHYDINIREKAIGIYSSHVEKEIDVKQKLERWEKEYILLCSGFELSLTPAKSDEIGCVVNKGTSKILQELFESKDWRSYFELNERIEATYKNYNFLERSIMGDCSFRECLEYLRWITIRYYRSLDGFDKKTSEDLYNVLQNEYDVRWNFLMDEIRKTESELHNQGRPERIRTNTITLFSFIKMLPDSIAKLDEKKELYLTEMNLLKERVLQNKSVCLWIDRQVEEFMEETRWYNTEVEFVVDNTANILL